VKAKCEKKKGGQGREGADLCERVDGDNGRRGVRGKGGGNLTKIIPNGKTKKVPHYKKKKRTRKIDLGGGGWGVWRGNHKKKT